MNAKMKEQTLKIEQLENSLEKLKDGKQLMSIQSKSIEHQREYLVEVRYLEKLIRLEKEKLEGIRSEKKVSDSELKDITGKLDFIGKFPKNSRH